MNKLVLVTAALLVPLVTYACSGDDENAPNEAVGATAGQAGRTSGASGGPTLGGATGKGGTNGGSTGIPSGGARPLGGAGGSISSVGGAAGNSGTVGLAGRASVAGHAGTGSAVGAAGSGKVGGAGGAAGGNSIAGGASNGGHAGGSAGVAGALTLPAAGSGATTGSGGTGTSVAGTSASAGNGSAGVAGATNASCNALCGAANCSSEPACLADAYGYSDGDAIPLCVPEFTETQFGVTLCGATTCNGAAGCPMMATLGTTTWTLLAGSAARSTDVRLDTIVTSLTGPISATGALSCTMNATLPTGGVPIVATGVAAPAPANPERISLNFDQIDAPLAGMGVSSSNSLCVSLMNTYIASALPAMRTAMLDGINARAAVLSCLDCRGDCPQQLACVAPAP